MMINLYISTGDFYERLRLNSILWRLLALRMYTTYSPSQKLYSIRISVPRDIKEIKHIKSVSKSLSGKCLRASLGESCIQSCKQSCKKSKPALLQTVLRNVLQMVLKTVLRRVLRPISNTILERHLDSILE